MQIIIPGFGEDTIHPVMKSLSIRTCYLFSSQLRLAGNVHYMFDMEKEFRSMNIQDKLEFIIEEDKDGEDESNEKIKEALVNYKKLKSIKNKNKETLVLLKKFERHMESLFETVLEEFMAGINVSQLPELKTLAERDSFNYYHVVYHEPETETHEQGSLSKLLSLQLDEEDEQRPTLMHLDYELFNDEFFRESGHKKPSEKFSGNGFLVPVIKIKNMMWFTVTDIDAMQFRMTGALTNFREQVSRFAGLKSDPVQAYHRLISNVVPASRVLQEMLDNDEAVKAFSVHTAFTEPGADFFTGMIPWQMMWDYFEYINLADDTTLNALKQVKNIYPLVPVTALRPKNEFTPNAKIKAEKPTAQLKKSLSID
jgi:hypothetical protein